MILLHIVLTVYRYCLLCSAEPCTSILLRNITKNDNLWNICHVSTMRRTELFSWISVWMSRSVCGVSPCRTFCDFSRRQPPAFVPTERVICHLSRLASNSRSETWCNTTLTFRSKCYYLPDFVLNSSQLCENMQRVKWDDCRTCPLITDICFSKLSLSYPLSVCKIKVW